MTCRAKKKIRWIVFSVWLSSLGMMSSLAAREPVLKIPEDGLPARRYVRDHPPADHPFIPSSIQPNSRACFVHHLSQRQQPGLQL